MPRRHPLKPSLLQLATVPERDPNKKLYLPSKFYPLNIFPRYISGSGYVITSSIVPMLYTCMLRTPYMNLVRQINLLGLLTSSLSDQLLASHFVPFLSYAENSIPDLLMRFSPIRQGKFSNEMPLRY